MSDSPLLLLFDVDGTLLRGATEAHGAALHAALHEVHGIDAARVRATVSPAGRTDGEIARAMLLAAGISAKRIDDGADDVRDACCRLYAELCQPDLSEFVLPGVPELLASLSEAGAKLALVTGNYEPIARLKLARAGVGRWFAAGQGAFGSDAEDRVALPAIARRRAGGPGHPFPRERTVVIGDTPRDIACAHADEVRCIAVATGPFSASELTGADRVVSNASEIAAAIAAL